MKRFLAFIILAMAGSAILSPLAAQGEATVLFLMVNPGARQGGMGEAGVALPDDANAVYWNPAGLGFQFIDEEVDSRGEATIMHVQWLPQFNLGDLYYDFFAARYHLDGIGTLGFSIQYLNYGENVQTDNEGNILGTFTSNEIAVTGSYGMRLMDNLGLGANLKFIYSRLSPVEVDAQKGEGVGSTFALDLGVLYLPGWSSRLNLGANLSNLGPKITYIDRDQADPIPTNLRLGAAYKLVDSEFNRLTAVYDINRLLVPQDAEKRQDSFLTYLYSGWGGDNFVDRFTHSVGLEYWYTDLIALRSGYFFESDKAGGRQFWTFGGGLNVSVIGIDFSYILGGSEDSPLNDTIRFSLSARF